MKIIFKYKLSIVIAIAIFYLSFMKPPKIDTDIHVLDYYDKIIHFLMYAIFTTSLTLETKNSNKIYIYFIILLISTIFGGAIEILQSYFPPRTASWGDFIADAIGSALPLVIISLFWIYDYGHKQKGKAGGIEPD